MPVEASYTDSSPLDLNSASVLQLANNNLEIISHHMTSRYIMSRRIHLFPSN
jgi:hypothetical protein